MRTSRITSLMIILSVLCIDAYAQSVGSGYFVDGYHGGVYGHYPEQYTEFIVEQLKTHPEWKINLEIEPETWDVIAIWEPRAYGEFRDMIELEDSQIEYINPTYAQPYMYNIYGESIIRQFQLGMNKLHKHFPKIDFLTYSVEEPCFTSCLPTILSSYGFKYASTKNPNTCWGGYFSAYGNDLIDWIGPDGRSHLLTSPRYNAEVLDDKSCWRTTASDMSRDYINASIQSGVQAPVGMCIQDAGWRGGPWLGNQALSIKPDSSYTLGVKYTLWRDYFKSVKAEGITTETHTFTQEDVKPGLVWGAQILQKLSRQVRASENKLLMGEKLASLATLEHGADYPTTDFDEAWRTLSLAQHHDCWVVPANRNRYKKSWADLVCDWTTSSDRLVDRVVKQRWQETPEYKEITVLNTTGTTRHSIAKAALIPSQGFEKLIDRNGKEIAYQRVYDGSGIVFMADVPAFGYTTYTFVAGTPTKVPTHKTTINKKGIVTVNNSVYTVTFNPDKGGAITSLIRHSDKKEITRGLDGFQFNGLRAYLADKQEFSTSDSHKANIEIIENGPVRTVIEIKGEVAEQYFTQKVTLVNGSQVVDCTLTIDWDNAPVIGKFNDSNLSADNPVKAFYNDKYKLHLTFPTLADGGKVIKDAPFDICNSTLEDTFYDSWREIKHNVMLSWVDLESNSGESIAMFCDHTNSYLQGREYPLGLNVQFIGKGLWGVYYGAVGKTTISYAIIPHRGSWQDASIETLSKEWNEPLVVKLRANAIPEKSFIDLKDSGYELSSTFFNEGDLYVRLYNPGEKNGNGRISLGFVPTYIQEVELDGRTKKEYEIDKDLSINIPDKGIATLKISIK